MLKAICFLLLVAIASAFNSSALPSLDQVGTCIASCILDTGHTTCGQQFFLDDASVQCACTNPQFNTTVQQCVKTNRCPQSDIDLTNNAFNKLCQNMTLATTSAPSSMIGSATAQTSPSSVSPATASADAAAGSSKEFPFSGSAVAVFVVLTVGTLFF
ncbi:unnamed protein product [Umbelopsis vinacea]